MKGRCLTLAQREEIALGRGVHVQDQRLLGVAAVIRRLLTGETPTAARAAARAASIAFNAAFDFAGQHVDRS